MLVISLFFLGGGGGRGAIRVDQIFKVGNKWGNMVGTREHRLIFDGNKGTWTPPGRPSLMARIVITIVYVHFSFVISTDFVALCTVHLL